MHKHELYLSNYNMHVFVANDNIMASSTNRNSSVVHGSMVLFVPSLEFTTFELPSNGTICQSKL